MQNESIHKRSLIPHELHGKRIDAALVSLWPEFSRNQLSQWIKQGQIKLNQKACKPKDKVAQGDLIEMSVQFNPNPLMDPKPQVIPLNIIFENDSILVINKPAGLVVHPGAGNPNNTLMNALLHHASSLQLLPRAGIVHRLDKDTTGLMVIAKTLQAHTALVRQMQSRLINRYYLTLVQGHLIAGGEVNTFYGRHPKNRLKMAVRMQGKEAITFYSIRQHYQDFTLLEVKLLTGRTHQIRVHMSHINHPVVGDPLYGKKLTPKMSHTNTISGILELKRQLLHAYKLSFLDPQTQEELTFIAPLPDDFQGILNALDENFE